MSSPELALKPMPVTDPPSWLSGLHGAHRELFERRLGDMPETLVDADRDGLHHLLPVLLVTGQDVATMRRDVGRAVWRKIHHASEQTNFLRSLIWLRFEADACWGDIVNLKQAHLRSCRNAIDWQTAKLADRLAEPGRFLQVSMLYRDVVKMGGEQSKKWSLSRLKREHARLSTQCAIADADPQDWCPPFQTLQDGFTFARLTSERDFVIEGKTQRHCVGSMRDEAKKGRIVVMRCTGRERATLLIKSDKSLEVASSANGAVSDRCLAAAKAASAVFLRQELPPI